MAMHPPQEWPASTGRSSSRSSIRSSSRPASDDSSYRSMGSSGVLPKPGPSTASTWKPAFDNPPATSPNCAPDWPSPSACQKTTGTSLSEPHSCTCSIGRPYGRRPVLMHTYRKLGSGRAVGIELFRGDLLADLLERAPDEPRHVHLRDADLLRDLRLREPLEEAEVQDAPLALVEHLEPWRQHRAVLRHLVLVLHVAERLERIEILTVFGAAAGRERQRRVRATGLERLEHLFLLDARRLRELGDRRRASELHRQPFDELGELHVQLLQAARDTHRPAAVAEVALDLADDVRRCVRRELDAAREVEAIDCLDQADRPDLHQVVELFAAVAVPACERAHQRHVLLDQLLACRKVAFLVVPAEQDLVTLSHEPKPSSSDERTDRRRERRRLSTRAHGAGSRRRSAPARSRRATPT